MYVVVLAGGGGTRLWPLSTPERPKPFLPLTGERSLLQATLDRVVGHPELPLTIDDVTVVTDRRYATLVSSQLPEVAILSEPAWRNTAAAIALAAIAIERAPDEVMIVLPADHRITDEAAQRRALRVAAELAGGAFGLESPLVTLGVRPTRPATDYGYLLPDAARRGSLHGCATAVLAAFDEKPGPARAEELLERGAAWNAGVFVWRRAAVRDALARYTGLVTLLEPVRASEAALADAYDRILPLSIDRAIMEGAAADGRVVMASMDAGWSDLGSWTALLEEIGVTGSGRVIQADQPAEAGPHDLLVERVDGRLTVLPGPRGILATTPVALLSGAAGDLPRVEALVRRINDWEESP